MNRVGAVVETATFGKPKLFDLRHFLLPFCFFLFLSSFSQSTAPFVFMHYGTPEGLGSNEICKVQQDRAGYLWVGTSNGLQRFDGIRFRSFRHDDNDSASLPSNILSQLYIDRNDVLWGATYKAEIFQFDKARFTCKRIPVRSLHPEKMRTSENLFIPDLDGHLFLLTMGSQLLMYDEKKSEFSAAANFIPVPKEWNFVGFAHQPGTKKYWMGLLGGGIAIYNKATGNLSYRGHNAENEPAVDLWGDKQLLLYPTFDKNNRLWSVAWGPGIPLYVQYNLRQPTVPPLARNFYARVETYHELGGFMEQANGRIWVRGLNVLAYYDEQVNDFVLVKSGETGAAGIKYEAVVSLFEDRENNVWTGTTSQGLYRFQPFAQPFTNVLHLKRFVKPKTGDGAVMSFAELKNGNILTGTWEDAMFQYTADLKPLPLPKKMPYQLANAYTWSMWPSADSEHIWMGAQPGFWQFNQRTGEARFYNPPALENRTVRQLAEDAAGNLWLGLHNFGVFRYLKQSKGDGDSVVRVQEVGKSMINAIVADQRGWVWIGTPNDGLFAFDGATARLVKRYPGGLHGTDTSPAYGISSLLDYNDSLMLISDDSRLYSYNRRTGKLQVEKVTGSLSGTICALEKDNEGYVWMSTSNALYRVHLGQHAAMKFDRQDGILNDQFVLNAAHRLRDGRLLFGTNNSFIAFDPKAAAAMPPPPQVHITSLQLGQQELPVDSVLALKTLEINAKNSALTVEFSALMYRDAYLIQYKMEGIDADWRFADVDGKITYPFLPPARYRLLLRTYEPNGRAVPLTVLSLRVRPPWYQSWWFYTLVAIAFVTELWWLDRQRSQRKQSMQKVRTDIAANLHEEVNTALNNINILSEIARLKSDKEPQKAKEYLEQIHTKSHNMIIALDDMLWSLDPENDSMKKTITRIREFADALMQRHRTLIELLIDKKVEKLELNMKLRHEAFLLFKEGLRNLVEAGTPHCIVHLTAERTKLLFTIEFANEGCDMQQLNNLLQRHDMAMRIQSLKAKLDVQLHKSRSLFVLQLPLGQG